MTPRHARAGDDASTDEQHLLQVSEVSVTYGQTVAVAAVSLQVGPGELIALTGRSGAGKSSLLNSLAGVIHPASGQISINGQPLRSAEQANELRVVLIPQGNALVRVLTALENVALPLLGGAGTRADARDRAQQALALLGLEDASGQLVEELSGGQQQRAAVARGLVVEGALLLADEPTSELDAANRTRVMALLRLQAERGAGVLVATHDPDAAAVCDAELRLDEGAVTIVRDDRPGG
ncbi:putative ABC transport system ATP-binding protein [Jatrophihabitans sp. GAS493]|uniref:ABC transporter ATP-binding protein n=1 Tax=Jatrophihabitans sp. GAS493 TaxID=1907575 RepID=UPI000BB72751|nr:ATP-binding cassette domain-containing protein [Jatrophihabitans sp. GAS493]SOD71427.1 putative ABC transport system ATP-binding protein [Jatrophihabitans sp. GAS493]